MTTPTMPHHGAPVTPTQERRARTTPASTFGDWGALAAFVDVALIVLLVAVSLLPVLPAYGSQGALYAVIGGVLTGALPVVIGAYARWALPITLVVTFGVYILVGGIIAYGPTLIAGVLPSRESIQGTLVGLVASWKQALTLDPPLGGDTGLLLLPFLMGFLGAFIAASLAVRRRTWTMTLLAASIPLVTLAVGILWGTSTAPRASLIGMLIVVSIMVWGSWRMRTWRPRRVAALAVVLVASVVIPLVTAPMMVLENPRFVLRTVVEPPFDPQDQISPLSQYRYFIKEFADTDLVTVTDLPDGATVRLATMDRYDGVVWSVSGDGDRAGSGAFRRIGERVESTVEGPVATTTIDIHALRGVWLPTVGYLSGITYQRGVAKDVRYNDATGTAIDVKGISEGLSYSVTSVVPPQPTDEQLGDARAGRIAIADADNIPTAVAEQASLVAREASTVPLVVRSFEQFFVERGFFSHGEQVSGYASLSGHGSARIAELLGADLMVGDAEQYASAMALFARQQGFASRVVMGFAPTEDERAQGDSLTFTGSDMDAWVEVYFDGHGWVSYFPTPDESKTPNLAEDQSEPEPQPDSIQPPPDPAPSVTPPEPDIEDPIVDTEEDDQRSTVNWAAIVRVVATVGIPVLLILGPPLLIVALKLRRRRSRSRTRGRDKAIGAWNELIDAARDHKITIHRDHTRREAARYLERVTPARGVVLLADHTDRAVFAPTEPRDATVDTLWNDALEYVKGLGADQRWYHKVRARVSLASLRHASDAHTRTGQWITGRFRRPRTGQSARAPQVLVQEQSTPEASQLTALDSTPPPEQT